MVDQYGPILIFIAIAAIIFPALLWIAKFFRPSFKPTPEKVLPYECGITPESDARGRYTVRFYVVAILFVVFEVETVFLYPWAVQFQVLGLLGLVEMLVFLGILIVGYIWLWNRGALKWI
ncbi:MAG: NADH-quinone oxidoreductase subunit A [Terriglobia bacterium]|jgi:NADH-quinone oxidoreductase subunit A